MESKFEFLGSERRQLILQRHGEHYGTQCLQPTVKHWGGSMALWGCISAFGVGKLVKNQWYVNKREGQADTAATFITIGVTRGKLRK